MNDTTSALFTPYRAGDLQLTNRIVMAPLTRSRSTAEGVPPQFAADYYSQRAGAGLIVSEATNITRQAVGYALTPGIWSDAQVESWKHVTRSVHAAGGVMVLQLWHTGRISHPDLHDGALPVAPSAIQPRGQAFTRDGLKDFVLPRALETNEIPRIVEDYRYAATNAKRAGFDGVEIHSANNYLLEQFVRDSTNHRTDEYGGSVENRLRFPLAVVKAVTDVWGGGQRVGIRISPATSGPGEVPLDSDTMGTYGRYIDDLNAFNLAYLHMIEGVTQTTRDVPGVDFAALRRRFRRTYMANNLYDKQLAEEAIASGHVDLVAFGRPFLANPDLVERLRINAPLADAPKEYWYGGNEKGYSDWPALEGQEMSVR